MNAESYYNSALENEDDVCDYIYYLVLAKDSVTKETDPNLSKEILDTSYKIPLETYRDILAILLYKFISNIHEDKRGYILIAIARIYARLGNKGDDQIPFYGSRGFYRAACDKGNVDAMIILGKKYKLENIERSVYYYEKAYYEHGHFKALEILCDMDPEKNKDYEKHITDYYSMGTYRAVMLYARYMYSQKKLDICVESMRKAYYEDSCRRDGGNRDHNTKFLVVLGKLLLKQGKFEEGVKYLEVANDKGHDAAFAVIGIAYCDKDDILNAIKYFEKGLNLKERKSALLYLKLILRILKGVRCPETELLCNCIFGMMFPYGPHKYIDYNRFANAMSSDCLHRILELDVKRKVWSKLDPMEIFDKIVLENQRLKEENLHLRYAYGGEGMQDAMNDFYSMVNAQNNDETKEEESDEEKDERELDFDYDHDYPLPKRTTKEEAKLKAKLDRELDEMEKERFNCLYDYDIVSPQCTEESDSDISYGSDNDTEAKKLEMRKERFYGPYGREEWNGSAKHSYKIDYDKDSDTTESDTFSDYSSVDDVNEEVLTGVL